MLTARQCQTFGEIAFVPIFVTGPLVHGSKTIVLPANIDGVHTTYRKHAKAKSDAMRKRNEVNLGQREARLEKEKVAELTSMEEKLPELK